MFVFMSEHIVTIHNTARLTPFLSFRYHIILILSKKIRMIAYTAVYSLYWSFKVIKADRIKKRIYAPYLKQNNIKTKEKLVYAIAQDEPSESGYQMSGRIMLLLHERRSLLSGSN